MPGLLIGGLLVAVPGVSIIAPGEHPSAKVSAGDSRKRMTSWTRSVVLHSTGGKTPHTYPEGDSDGSSVIRYADYFYRDPQHGSVQLVVDGTHAICLTDLIKTECYHATTMNQYSIGIEMVQRADNSILSSTLDSTVAIVETICDVVGIPMQIDSTPYKQNKIIERLKSGGSDCAGVFGHRSQAWMFPQWLSAEQRQKWPNGYANRGWGDPGDEIFVRLKAAGAMSFDFDAKEDLKWWRDAQSALNRLGEKLTVDGQCGPGTVDALRRHRLWNGGKFAERIV